jgi:folate-dependent phosphoribosylglycinamide formyltransferase PurN
MEQKEEQKRKNIVFLSSSYVNLAKLFAMNNSDYDIFLILDRKFPFEIVDLDNFYTFTFDNNKLFYKNKLKYFDNLALYINQFEPDIIITNNFSKLLPNSFIDFFKFTSNIEIINIHHANLTNLDENNEKKYKGLSADIKQFLDEEKITSTIHKIEDEKMDEGKILSISHETTLKELKQKNIVHKKEDILNLRKRNLIISYHERTKVLNSLKKEIEKLI